MLADYEIRDARGEDVPRLVEFRKKIADADGRVRRPARV